jgi:hypothetical protein
MTSTSSKQPARWGRTLSLAGLCLLGEGACTTTRGQMAPNQEAAIMSVEDGTLAQRLMAAGYSAIFRDAGHERRLDAIWKSASQQDFELLAGDAKAPSLARLLSSQVLLSRDTSFFSRADLSSLVDVYIEALRRNETGMMSDWGFLHRNDDPGVLGSVFLVFGDGAVPQLIKLLNDGKVVDYERPSPDAQVLIAPGCKN